MKKLIPITLFMATVVFTSCSTTKDKTDGIAVTGISLNENMTIGLGSTKVLIPEITPADATNKDVTWKSFNETIVSVTPEGVIKGEKTGTAVIAVTTVDGGKSAICEVTVTEGEPQVKMLVGKIAMVDDDGWKDTYTFSYDDNGQIKKVTNNWTEPKGNGMFEYSYTRNGDILIISSSDSDESGTYTDTYNCSLNSDGFISTAVVEDESGTENISVTYQNGYLELAKFTNSKTSFSYTWQNGNLAKEVLEDEDDATTTFTYTSYANMMNVEILDLFGDFEAFDNLPLFTSGYLGKRNTNLPQKVETTNSSSKYSYEFDKDGYVTDFVQIYDEWDNSGNSYGPWTTTCKVTYITK